MNAANDNSEEEVRRFERHLPHPPETVWEALTEPAELAAWFPEDLNSQERVIHEYDPPRVLEYSIGNESLRWELSPTKQGGSILVLETRIHTSAVRMAA